LIDERPHSKAPWLVNADCQDSFKRQHIAYHFALVLHLGETATADAVAVSVSGREGLILLPPEGASIVTRYAT